MVKNTGWHCKRVALSRPSPCYTPASPPTSLRPTKRLYASASPRAALLHLSGRHSTRDATIVQFPGGVSIRHGGLPNILGSIGPPLLRHLPVLYLLFHFSNRHGTRRRRPSTKYHHFAQAEADAWDALQYASPAHGCASKAHSRTAILSSRCHRAHQKAQSDGRHPENFRSDRERLTEQKLLARAWSSGLTSRG